MPEFDLLTYVALNLVNVGANLVFAFLFWTRDRSIYSPGLVMCVIFFYLFNFHFLIEGYDHEIYARIPGPQLRDMQIWTSGVLITTLFLSYAFTPPTPRVDRTYDSNAIFDVLLLLGGVIFAVNLAWRFDQVDWDIDRFTTALLLSRVSEEWAQQGTINSGSAFDSLVRATFLFAPFAFAVTSQSKKPLVMVLSHVLLAASLALLFFGGSRTTFVAPAFFYAGLRILMSRNRVATGAMMIPLSLIVLYASSYVLNFRSVGFDRIDEFSDGDIGWHMDDNYPRLILTAWLAWEGTPKIDGITMALAALFGFVPRAIWPSKPDPDTDFFYPYKDFSYVTTSALGELNAAMNPVLAATVFALMIYLMVRFAYRIYRRPDLGGFAMLLTLYLYYYSILRSVFSVSAGIYIPALMFIAYRLTRGREAAVQQVSDPREDQKAVPDQPSGQA